MGPRFFNRGKVARPPPKTGPTNSFNGAAIFQSRKGPPLRPNRRLQRRLQWGRDFSIAERMITYSRRLGISWLQWGRDFSIAESHNEYTTNCAKNRFNGAAIFQSRKEFYEA